VFCHPAIQIIIATSKNMTSKAAVATMPLILASDFGGLGWGSIALAASVSSFSKG
jgi:hypothetical protein